MSHKLVFSFSPRTVFWPAYGGSRGCLHLVAGHAKIGRAEDAHGVWEEASRVRKIGDIPMSKKIIEESNKKIEREKEREREGIKS